MNKVNEALRKRRAPGGAQQEALNNIKFCLDESQLFCFLLLRFNPFSIWSNESRCKQCFVMKVNHLHPFLRLSSLRCVFGITKVPEGSCAQSKGFFFFAALTPKTNKVNDWADENIWKLETQMFPFSSSWKSGKIEIFQQHQRCLVMLRLVIFHQTHTNKRV